MSGVFVYWDNSNIFIGAQQFAAARERSPGARYLVRLEFDNLLRLAHADRPLVSATAVGPVPPELRRLWTLLENRGVTVKLCNRVDPEQGEQNMPDYVLQLGMLEDGFDYNGAPGTAVLLTGDGAGFYDGAGRRLHGMRRTMERLHKRGWKVEILSWGDSCNQRMRQWAEANGVFVSLDDYYTAITFLEPSRPGFPLALPRDAAALDLARRPLA